MLQACRPWFECAFFGLRRSAVRWPNFRPDGYQLVALPAQGYA